MAAPGNATAGPLSLGGTLTLGTGSHLDLTVGAPASGASYLFIQYGAIVDNGVVFGFSGQGVHPDRPQCQNARPEPLPCTLA